MSSVVSTRWGTDENQIGGSGGAVISANLSEAEGIQNHKPHNQQQTRILFTVNSLLLLPWFSNICVVKRGLPLIIT